jgi:hypothetical protein
MESKDDIEKFTFYPPPTPLPPAVLVFFLSVEVVNARKVNTSVALLSFSDKL